MKRNLKLFPVGCVFILATTQSFAQDVDTGSMQTSRPGEISLAGQFSSDVQEGQIDALFSIAQPSENTLWFADLRGAALENSEWEGNAGIVLRSYDPDRNWILGGNLFYDHRWTDHDNEFGQIGGGLEWLGRLFDARVNVFLPIDDPQIVSDSTSVSVTRENNTEVSTSTTTRVYEESLEGMDGELGVWMRPFTEQTPVGAFVRYSHFEGDYGDDISGFSARLEARFSEKITLDFEWFEDEELVGTDYLVGIRFRHQFGAEFNGESKSVQRRMTESIRRGFGMRTRLALPIEEELMRTARSLNGGGRSVEEAVGMEIEDSGPICTLNSEGDIVCF